jgi:hypothetical protein
LKTNKKQILRSAQDEARRFFQQPASLTSLPADNPSTLFVDLLPSAF